MSSFKTTARRAPVRHARPFIVEFPLTSLVYEGGNYYSQDQYAYWNHSFDGSFSGKSVFLYVINNKDVNEKAREYELQISGIFTTTAGLLCDAKKDTTIETEKKEKKYFWNENLLFIKRTNGNMDESKRVDDSGKCEDEITAVFQLCRCKNCRKKAGIPMKSLRPIKTEMCFSISISPNDPPRFANIPVILKPAMISLSQDETVNSMLTKTGLVPPQYLAYFTEIPCDMGSKFSNKGNPSITMSQIAFADMAAKLVQLLEMELVDWTALDAGTEKELKMKSHQHSATLDVIPESPPMSTIISSDTNLNPPFQTPAFTGISTLERTSFSETLPSVIYKETEKSKEDQIQCSSVIENLKWLAGTKTETVPVKRPSTCLKTMLEDEIGTDWEIISTDGKVVKCHLAVLATQVPFFRSLVSGEEGSQTNVISGFAMPSDTEMDEVAVKAFLRFIYYQDTELMKNSFQTCFTLLRTGHWHQLSSLIVASADVIINRSHRLNHLGWFNITGLWKLFEFVRSWEIGDPMRTELLNAAIDVLKLLLVKTNKANGLLKITNGNEVLADLIFGFITR